MDKKKKKCQKRIGFQKATGRWGAVTHIGTPFGIFAIKDNREKDEEVTK